MLIYNKYHVDQDRKSLHDTHFQNESPKFHHPQHEMLTCSGISTILVAACLFFRVFAADTTQKVRRSLRAMVMFAHVGFAPGRRFCTTTFGGTTSWQTSVEPTRGPRNAEARTDDVWKGTIDRRTIHLSKELVVETRRGYTATSLLSSDPVISDPVITVELPVTRPPRWRKTL